MAVYVCSDIHGLKDRYDAMMNKVSALDHLYILGDVVDRGPFGMEILWDVMHRDNVTMLLGNHELMMKEYYEAKWDRKFSLTKQFEVMSRWRMNHCEATIRGFEAMGKAQQLEILTFIHHQPVAICDLIVEGRCYYLVHGAPVQQVTTGTISQQEALENGLALEQFVWNRIQYAETFFQDRTVIVGHTPTLCLQTVKPYEIWSADQSIQETNLINIDCGCAANNEFTRLALLRLDDREVFYF